MNKVAQKLPWLREMARVVSITDAGKDPDDENAMIMLGNFTLQGLVHLMATVANLSPQKFRAELTKATYELLGLEEVSVGIGTDCRSLECFDPENHQWQAPYLRMAGSAANRIIQDGQKLLKEQFEAALDSSITMLLISGMTDAAKFVTNHPRLFASKIKEVVIMGGVRREAGQVMLYGNGGFMIPDSAANNAFDMQSAEFLYQHLQAIKVKMRILTREAAYAVPFPRSLYDEMAATGHPVGVKLMEMQKTSIQNLWLRANLPAESKLRELPPRCDRDWFCDTFCGGEGKDLKGCPEIWPYIKNFMLYDPMALVAAIPAYRKIYYEPHVVKVRGISHEIIGLSKEVTGVKYPEALRGFIHSQIVSSLDIFSQYLEAANY